MFRTIIVGVDGREGGRDALALATTLQGLFSSEVIAVHAFPDSFFVGHGADAGLHEELSSKAKAVLRDELAKADSDATPIVVADSSPARVLHTTAEHHHADLIVVGSDHHGPVGRVLPGDVTASTLHAAPCAVAVAPRSYADADHRIRTVGVAYNGAAEAELALTAAVELVHATGAKADVTYVQTPFAIPTGWTPYAAMANVEIQRDMREEATRQVSEATARFEQDGFPAVGQTPDGLAHEGLAELSRRADVVLIGSRGYGPLRRLLLGSTSSKLVRDASCPVIAVPRGSEEQRPLAIQEILEAAER